MKNTTLKISLILVILIFIMPGCLDIWITTEVKPNGSINQTIVFQGDSAEIAEVPFALMKENDWKREWSKPEKDKYKLVVSKEFSSVKELNKTMNPVDTNLQVVRVNSTLNRKFRWFYTRFVFEEKVLVSNPFKCLEYKDSWSDEEIRLIASNEEDRKTDPAFDSVKYKVTEKKFEDFLFRSMFECFYNNLLSVLADNKSLTLKKEDLDLKKDVIYRFLIDSVKNDGTDDLLIGLGKVINHPDIQTIRSKYLSSFDEFQRKMKFFNAASDDNYKFAIRMPGLLLQTNSPKIEGSETGWDLSYYNFFFKEYSMTAESRQVNIWAFIVAGLVLVISLFSLIVAFTRKR